MKYKEMKKQISSLQRKDWESRQKSDGVFNVEKLEIQLKQTQKAKNGEEMEKLMEEVKGVGKYEEQKYWKYYIEGYRVIEIEKSEKQIEREKERIIEEIEGVIQQIEIMGGEQQIQMIQGQSEWIQKWQEKE